MPEGILILPFIAGYIFCSVYYKTRFKYSQLSGQRIILGAAIYGCAFLFVSRIICIFLDRHVLSDEFIEAFKILAPWQYSGTLTLTLIIAVTLVISLNGLGHFFSWLDSKSNENSDKPWRALTALRKKVSSYVEHIPRIIRPTMTSIRKWLPNDKLAVQTAISNNGDYLEKLFLRNANQKRNEENVLSIAIDDETGDGEPISGWVEGHPCNIDGKEPFVEIQIYNKLPDQESSTNMFCIIPVDNIRSVVYLNEDPSSGQSG